MIKKSMRSGRNNFLKTENGFLKTVIENDFLKIVIENGTMCFESVS